MAPDFCRFLIRKEQLKIKRKILIHNKQMAKQKFTLDLEAALEPGEGHFIEFKELPDKSLTGEIVAFANASCGIIYLARTDYMEKAGTDIKRVTDACNANGNKCIFNFSDAFWVTMKTNNKDNVPEKVLEKLTKNKKSIIEIIKRNPHVSAREPAPQV
jgi:predicted HTH transcriptional regulator